jgi:Flp pilus assembly pilin Flp
MDTFGKTGPRRVVQAGQGLVEYALILALIAVVAISGTLFLGKEISKVLANMGSSIGGNVAGVTQTGTTTTTATTTTTTTTTTGPPWTYGSPQSCTQAGYQWHSGICRYSSPSSYTDQFRCEQAGYDWEDYTGHPTHLYRCEN